MDQNEETVLDVQGMSCPSCIGQLKDALRDVTGVSSVEVRLSEGQVMVKHAGGTAVEKIVEALRDAGYESSPSSGA